MSKDILVSDPHASGGAFREVHINKENSSASTEGNLLSGWVGSSAEGNNRFTSFKSVLLCDRPKRSTGGPKPSKAEGERGKQPWISAAGIVRSAPGLVPARDAPAPVELFQPRAKIISNPANLQHKKWLKEFSKLSVMKREEKSQEDVQQEERRKRIIAAAEKQRKAIRGALEELQSEPELGNDRPVQAEALETTLDLTRLGKSPEATRENTQRVLQSRKASRRSSRRGSHNKKPVWALTEEQAKERAVEDEEEEVDSLLTFAENLDFESYMQDFEVRDAMKHVFNRIYQIETERLQSATEEDRNGVGQDVATQFDADAIRAELQQKQELREQFLKAWRSLYGANKQANDALDAELMMKKEAGWDAKSTTSEVETARLLQADRMKREAPIESFKQIHSKQSLVKVIDSVQEETSQARPKQQ